MHAAPPRWPDVVTCTPACCLCPSWDLHRVPGLGTLQGSWATSPPPVLEEPGPWRALLGGSFSRRAAGPLWDTFALAPGLLGGRPGPAQLTLLVVATGSQELTPQLLTGWRPAVAAQPGSGPPGPPPGPRVVALPTAPCGQLPPSGRRCVIAGGVNPGSRGRSPCCLLVGPVSVLSLSLRPLGAPPMLMSDPVSSSPAAGLGTARGPGDAAPRGGDVRSLPWRSLQPKKGGPAGEAPPRGRVVPPDQAPPCPVLQGHWGPR